MHTIPFITVFVLLFQSTGVILAGIGLAAIGFGGKYIYLHATGFSLTRAVLIHLTFCTMYTGNP